MDGRKGFRRLREPPPGTRSSRRGRRAHDLTAGGGGRGRGRVKENPYLNHPPPHHHHHENLEYSRRGQDQGYNDGYEGTDYHHSYGPGQADSSGDSGYNSLHQPPGEAHLSSNRILVFGNDVLCTSIFIFSQVFTYTSILASNLQFTRSAIGSIILCSI